MSSLLVLLIALLAVTMPTSTQAQDSNALAAQQGASSRVIQPEELTARSATGKPLVDADSLERGAVVPALAVNRQTAVACNMCFTCGGDWPVFAGAIHAVNTGSATFERGSACSGSLLASNDTNPFLCCR